VKESILKSTKYFKTYEEREEAFRSSVFSLIPRRYSGPKLFWSDFRRISVNELLKLIEQPIAYITSNPRDCLAFSTPWQVLTAAQLSAQNRKNEPTPAVEEIARDFGVYENLFQPIRTLSGGETVKLALAKAYLCSAFSRQLTIASPFSWLSRDNARYFHKLFQYYLDFSIPVELLALIGEDSIEHVDCYDARQDKLNHAVEFSMLFKNARISLGSSLNPIQSQDTYAKVDDFSADLMSPCLVVGENGQGKSLIARVISGAISCLGSAQIDRKDKSGPARLLFQDVITQTLLRSFDAIAASTDRCGETNSHDLYEKILLKYFSYLNGSTTTSPGVEIDSKTEFRSLLEIKAILVAVRLCGQPCALILDEPDWGLNRESAIAFVFAIVDVSHELGTPVLLISHKPWWHKLAKSIIHVSRTAKEMTEDRNYSFQIKLTCGEP
jgi:ABC-type multidrug transport system ATPase subunit